MFKYRRGTASLEEERHAVQGVVGLRARTFLTSDIHIITRLYIYIYMYIYIYIYVLALV